MVFRKYGLEITNFVIKGENHMQNTYEKNALLYAEKFGIIEYKLQKNIMVWYESLPTEGYFKHQLNLYTMNHVSIKLQKKPRKKVTN
jgi:hypothetical protein